MNDNPKKFVSAEMRILAEFPLEYENDELITKPAETEGTKLYIGSLADQIVIGELSRINDRIRGLILIEAKTLPVVKLAVEELLDANQPESKSIVKVSGADNLVIYYTNSQPHNLPAPFERINIENKRIYELDNLRSRDVWLSLPPKMARRLAQEIAKLV